MEFLPSNGLPMDKFAVTKLAAGSEFRAFSLFPKETEGKVAMAFGLAVFVHSNVHCPDIEEWKTKIWLPRVSSILAFTANFPDIYASPAYWRNIPMYILELARGVCPNSDYLAAIERSHDLSLEASDFLLRLMCRLLCFDLAILRKTCTDCTAEVVRCEDAIGLPVILAEEGGDLLFLYHKSLFPGDNSSVFPLHFSPPKPRMVFSGFRSVSPSRKPALITANLLLRSVLACISIAGREGVSRDTLERIARLRKKCRGLRVNEAMYALAAVQAERLEDVRERSEEFTDDSHPVTVCEDYALLEPSILLPGCEHRFHIVCLSTHFQRQLDSGASPSSLSCPTCSRSLSAHILLKLRLQSPPDPVEISPELPEEANPLPPDFFHCGVCKDTKHIRYLLKHDHAETHYCCVTCFENATYCPVCGNTLPEDSKVWLQQAFAFLRISN